MTPDHHSYHPCPTCGVLAPVDRPHPATFCVLYATPEEPHFAGLPRSLRAPEKPPVTVDVEALWGGT